MLKKRRSIRSFQQTKIEEDKIQQLLKAALLSPSSKNNRPWEFIVVTDDDLLEKLSLAKPHGAAFLKNAPLGIVVIGNPGISDVWIEDTAIASIITQLTAESMGLGSCWIQIRERQHSTEKCAEEYIQGLLGIPENKKVEAIIALGYPSEQKNSPREESIQNEKIHRNQYGNQ